MKKINNYLFVITLSLLLYCSCDNNRNQSVSYRNSNVIEMGNNKLQIKSLLLDTVQQNKSYAGFIIYKSPFDSVTTKMFGNTYNRRVVLKLDPDTNYSVDKGFYVDSLSLYRFVAYDNRRIPYHNVSFHNIGVFHLKGEIEDSYLVDNERCEGCKDEISIQRKFIKKIIVVK